MTDWATRLLDDPPPATEQDAPPPAAATVQRVNAPAWSDRLLEAPAGPNVALPPRPPGQQGDGSVLSQGAPGRPRNPHAGRAWNLIESPVVDDPARAASAPMALRANLPPDDVDKIRRFAAARFPGQPLEEAVKRYGIIDGNIVYHDPESGQVVREMPSVTGATGAGDFARRALRWGAAETPAAIPGIAGGAAGAMTGGAAAMPVAMGVAGVTDVVRQGLDRAIAGEPVTDINWLNSGLQGLAAGGGEGVRLLAGRLLSRNPLGIQAWEKLAALDPARMRTAESVMAAAKEHGIPLTAGEATGLQSLLVQQRQLGRFPETADAMGERILDRNAVAVPRAVRAELDRIARPESAEAGIGGMRSAAKSMIEAADTRRTAIASPHYERAFNSGVEPDIGGTVALLDQELAGVAKGTGAFKQLGAVKNMLGQAVDREVQPGLVQKVFEPIRDYRQLHSAKEAIDGRIADLMETGSNEEKRALRALQGIKADLTTALKNAHPEYNVGREKYIQMSAPLEALQKGVAGVLNRKTTPIERESILDAVFSSGQITPEAVTRARNAFLINGFREDWENGLRAWLDGKLARAMQTNVNDRPGNVPGKLASALWGDERQAAILRAAIVDPARVQGFERLMDVLKAAGRALPEGSPTATDLGGAMVSDRVGRVARVAGKLTSPGTLLSAGDDLAAAYSALRQPQARRKLAEALWDPESLGDLRRLRLLSPKSEKAVGIASKVISRLGVTAGLSAMGLRHAPDFDPESAQGGPE